MMQPALELAARGIGLVSPGPLVGCVIIDERQQTVGEGFYVYDEVKHAETIALEQAGESARGATTYISLEPHAHQGRTPPCTDALIKAGVKRVVAPIDDPLLTDRSGKKRRRPLARVVIEQYLQMSPESRLVQTSDTAPVIIFAGDDSDAEMLSALQSRGVEVINQGSALDLGSTLEELG